MSADGRSLTNKELQDALDLNHGMIRMVASMQSLHRHGPAQETLEMLVESLTDLGQRVDQIQLHDPESIVDDQLKSDTSPSTNPAVTTQHSARAAAAKPAEATQGK
eukprot:TRINITY_DN14699_c0_g1_i1.p1 TRINITY_DN14699_c0_g1~~TRINITY_DN14699_c0_g1_i1.p1  ORF type:complete len:106 (+),score=13.15 TRINITY_DN14699_c0_g1_i1:125-442(+)